MMAKKRDGLYLFILIIIAICFFVINAPRDFGDVGLSLYTTVVTLDKAHREGGSVLENFDKYKDTTFAFHTFSHPFPIFVMHFLCKITGITPYNFILLSIIVVFGTTIIAFYLGRMLYDSLFGFIFSLLLTVNVFYNVIFQTGTIYYTFCIPLTLISFFTFLRLHKNNSGISKKSVCGVIISALFFAIALFHVYPHALFGFVFSFLFVVSLVFSRLFGKTGLVEFNKDFKLLGIKLYLIFLIFIVVFYFSLTSFWEIYNRVPLGTVLKWSASGEIARNLSVSWEDIVRRLPWIASKTVEIIFTDIDKGYNFAQYGVHSDTSISGHPILNFMETLFFIAGIAYCFIKRSSLHIFCLSTLVFTIGLIVFKYYPPIQRAYFFVIPILTLFMAVGVREVFYGWFNQKVAISRKKVMFFTSSVLLIIIIWNFMSIYHFRVSEGGNKIWLNGLNQIFDFLEESGDKNNLVVFGDNNINTYGTMSTNLYVKNKFNDVIYYNKDLAQKTVNEFGNWMKNTLSTYDNIIFVFPAESYLMGNPGQSFGNYGMKRFYEKFLKANGYPLPSKVVRNPKGVPLHYIYKFNKQWLTKKFVEVKMGETILSSNSIYRIESFYVSGPVEITIKNGNNEWNKNLSFLTDGMDFYIKNTELKEGYIEYYPDFSTLEKASLNTTEIKNFKIVDGNSGLTWIESKQPANDLKYLFNFPFKIKRADVRTNPRIFNDKSLMNLLKIAYSFDNRLYVLLNSIRSNGNGRFGNNDGPSGGGDRQPYPMSGFNEYATYNVFYPESDKLYLNFKFMNATWSNGHVQLSSHDKSTFFKFTVDLSRYLGEIPLISDNSNITISGPEDSLVYLTLSEDIAYPDVQSQLTSLGYNLEDDVYATLGRFQKNSKIKGTRRLDKKTFEAIKKVYFNYFNYNTKNLIPIRLRGPGVADVRRELINNVPSWVDKLFLTYFIKSSGADKKYIDTQDRIKFWQVGGGPSIFRKSEEFVYDGKYSVMIGGDVQRKISITSINYIINPNVVESLYKHKVGFSAFLKADVPNAANLAIGIDYPDGGNERIQSDFHPGDGQWHQIKVIKELEKKPSALYAHIFNSGSVKDVIYADLANMYVDNKGKVDFLINDSFEEWEEIKTENETGLTGSELNAAAGEIVEVRLTERYKYKIVNPRYWQIGGDPALAEKENVEVYEGKTSVKLSGNTRSPYANLNFSMPSLPVADFATKTFRFASYIKTNRIGVANLQCGISYTDGSYEEIYSGFHPGDNQWHQISLTKKFEKPVKLLNVNVFNRGTDESIVYIDNTIYELDGNIQSEIPNCGYEEWDVDGQYKNSFKTHTFSHFILNDTWDIIREKVALHKDAQDVMLELNVKDMKHEQVISIDSFLHFHDPGKELDFAWSFDELSKPINLQKILLDMGYTICGKKDIFDGTISALKKVQNGAKLPETGLIDKSTLKVLFHSLSLSAVNHLQNGDFSKWELKDGFRWPVSWIAAGGARASLHKIDGNDAVAVTGATANSGHLYQTIPKGMIDDEAKGQNYSLMVKFSSPKSNLGRIRLLQILENEELVDNWSDLNSPDGGEIVLRGKIAKNVKDVRVFLWNQSPSEEDIVIFDDANLFIGSYDNMVRIE